MIKERNDPSIQDVFTGYEPRPHQVHLHSSMKRFNVLVCHRRFGKTVYVINEMIDQGLRNELKNPQYAYFAPFYGQAKRVAWDYFKDFTKDIPGRTVNEAELRIDIERPSNGDRIRFMLLGADNPIATRGMYFDGVCLDEFADMDPTIWSQIIRPTLSDRKGWAIFIGTPKGENHFFDVYQRAKTDSEWFSALYKVSETKIIPQKELDQARKDMDEDEYNQEFECSFSASIVGAYYAKLLDIAKKEGRITRVPYDPALSVDTFWDLGIDDSTAIWFTQVFGKEIRCINYLEDNDHSIPHYVKVLKEMPYAYGTHTLPHDAAARSMETGRTRQETFASLGLKNTRIQKKHLVEDGIHAAKIIIPKTWFDEEKCQEGLTALRHYKRQWDAKVKVFKSTPVHDWSSHGSDAFRVLALGVKEEKIDKLLPRSAESHYDIFSYGA